MLIRRVIEVLFYELGGGEANQRPQFYRYRLGRQKKVRRQKKKQKEKNIEINPNILQVFEEQGCVIPACVMFRPDSNHDIYLQYKREYIYIYEYN